MAGRVVVNVHLLPRWRQVFLSKAGPAVQRAADEVEFAAKRLAPVYPFDTEGRRHMRDRIHQDKHSGHEIHIVSPASYTKFVHGGTKPHGIASTGPWPMRNPHTGQIFGHYVNHPGARAQPFLTEALRVIAGRRF